jgi:hypothetical protein
MPHVSRIPLPSPERDAAAKRLALPPLTVAPTPGDEAALLECARVYGVNVAFDADPIAADRAEREAATEALDEIAKVYLLVSLPDDWSGIGDRARLAFAGMSAAAKPGDIRRDAQGNVTGMAYNAEQILSLQTAIEEVCIACVVGEVHVSPDGSQEEIEHYRLHRGPEANGLRPLASVPAAVQPKVREEVEAHLASFRRAPRRFRRG